jgi:hypothetical protein
MGTDPIKAALYGRQGDDVVSCGGGPRTVEAILTEDRGHFVRFTDGGKVGPLHGNIHLLEWVDG